MPSLALPLLILQPQLNAKGETRYIYFWNVRSAKCYEISKKKHNPENTECLKVATSSRSGYFGIPCGAKKILGREEKTKFYPIWRKNLGKKL